MKIFIPMLLSLTVLIAGQARGQQWGDLKMKFVYDGAAPAPKPINVDKDPQFCGKFGLVNEELVVNKENGGIANVVVFARSAISPVHPDYAELAKAKVTLDNKQCRFEPHICLLRTTQTLVLKNSDSVGHNTNCATLSNPPQNVLIPAGGMMEQHLSQAERIPAAPVSCNIHPWMKGYLVVQETPYAAVSDKNGEVTIKNLPPGKWEFQVWHELSGYVVDVKINGSAASWKRGRPELEIKAGRNDLGEIKFKPMAK